VYFFRLGGARNLEKAISILQQGMSSEPANPAFHLALATCQFWWHAYDMCSVSDAKQKMTEFIKSAEALSGSMSEIYYLKAVVKMNFDWDFPAAKRLFEKSLSIVPDSQRCTAAYSTLLANLGLISEALSNVERLLRLDPLSVSNLRNAAKILYKNNQYEAALVLLSETLEFSPKNYESLLLSAVNLVELHEYAEAHSFLDQANQIFEHLEPLSMKGYVYAKEGETTKAAEILATLETNARNNPLVPPTYSGIIYSALSKNDKAFECIDKSLETHHSEILSLLVDPRFSNLRDDNRFLLYVEKIGLNSGPMLANEKATRPIVS
jgi:tetratricopeptide (TPR) repeat protein